MGRARSCWFMLFVMLIYVCAGVGVDLVCFFVFCFRCALLGIGCPRANVYLSDTVGHTICWSFFGAFHQARHKCGILRTMTAFDSSMCV